MKVELIKRKEYIPMIPNWNMIDVRNSYYIIYSDNNYHNVIEIYEICEANEKIWRAVIKSGCFYETPTLKDMYKNRRRIAENELSFIKEFFEE